ncbi:hypothetical protein PFISCL1PPCAC_11091, partial [Pristionchus fissidentatus]
IVILSLFHSTSAHFSTDFTQYLDDTYGVGKRQYLERNDLQNRGSFGGRSRHGEALARNPVVFVHGVAHVAGSLNKEMTFYYKSRGYTDAELYATTYEDPKGDPLRWIHYTMKCDHVKRIRFMIEAVHGYTGRQVDVVAFSLGVPISRKAILGGKCVENGEEVGQRITNIVGTFIGVAGPNVGVAPIVNGISFALCAMSPLIPICNPVDGLFSGFCPFKSRFIDDINFHKHYEGGRVYSIGSKVDEVVGHMVCGDVSFTIATTFNLFFHKVNNYFQTFKHSGDVQIAMLSGSSF